MKPQHALLIVTAALVAVSACSGTPSSTGAGGTGSAAAPEMGTLALESKPQARVYIDDAPRGMTPLRLDLPAGPHRVRLEANSKARTLTVGVVAGAEVTQSVDLDRAVQTGSLFVRTDPAGAKVLVDNRPAGVTPITVLDLSPGSHSVSVTAPDGSNAKQSVSVEAGATATIRLSLDRPQVAQATAAAVTEPSNGWVLVDAPIEMQVLQGGRQIGTSGRRLPLAPGSYDLQLRAADYSTAKRVEVSAGRVARVEVNVPDGTVNLNAAPWAEVYLDGRSLGETPIANASVTAGTHEVIFRNPQFVELRQMVTVASGKATRLAVTLTKK
ncbi:MAG: PEGA domain-containing protein [Vicinamibacteraceae bacterium]